MKGSLPPSSRTTFLMAAPAWAPTARPAPTLPVRVTALTRRSAMMSGHLVGADQQRLEHAGRGAGPAEQVLEEQGRPGDVGRVLEEPDVAGHQGRGREPGHLPQRVVPRHDGQHRPQRLVGDEAQRGVHQHPPVGEEALPVLGEPAEAGGALGHLPLGLGERLPHLGGDDVGDVGQLALQQLGHRHQQSGPLLEGGGRPLGGRPLRQVEAAIHLGGVEGLERLDELAGGGVGGGQWRSGVGGGHAAILPRPGRPPFGRTGRRNSVGLDM